MTVLSGRGMVDREMRRRLTQIVPHLHRALRVNKAINAKQSAAATLSEALDGLGAGVFLVDARCHIVHANAAGRELLCTDDFLRSIGGRFAIRDARHDQALRKRFAAVAEIPADVDDVVLPLTGHDGERYVLHIMPLRSVTQIHPGASSGAVAALFVRKAELDGQSCADLVARSFELTRAESRVLFTIVQHGAVPETARALGIAETTVKTHLHRVFAKTGVSRQTDLIKLTAGYASPLASDATGRGH
jgi:DNA-binding CsgD family transcriptional regulator